MRHFVVVHGAAHFHHAQIHMCVVDVPQESLEPTLECRDALGPRAFVQPCNCYAQQDELPCVQWRG